MESNNMTEEKRKIIVSELTSNANNYKEAIDGLADVSMWLMDGTITAEDEVLKKILQILAKTRGHLIFLNELISTEKVGN